MQGIFITFEGPDGAGKTSVLKEVSERLAKESKRKIVTTREPGGIPIAEKIRTVILDPRNDRMDERTEATLRSCSSSTFSGKNLASFGSGSFSPM